MEYSSTNDEVCPCDSCSHNTSFDALLLLSEIANKSGNDVLSKHSEYCEISLLLILYVAYSQKAKSLNSYETLLY